MKHLIAAVALPALFLAVPALGADLIINEPETFATLDEPIADDWTGPYVGVNLGVAFGIPNFDTTDMGGGCDDWWCENSLQYPGDPTPLSDDNDDFFPFAGVQAGFNYQINENFVVGIEGDIQLANFGNHDDDEDDTPAVQEALVYPWPGDSFSATPDLDWWGTLRGRAGALVTPDTLIYGTAGLAFGHTNFDNMWWLPDDFDSEETRVGYAVGAGIEQKFTENVSAKLEYLFVNLGDQGDLTPFDDGDFNSDLSFHAVRAGLNFQF